VTELRALFDTRLSNALFRSGYRTLADLAPLTDEEILEIRSLGKVSLKCIRGIVPPPGTGAVMSSKVVLTERDELRAENRLLRLRGDTYLEQLQQKHAEIERLRAACALLHAALQDVVSSTGGGLIVQDYGRLNEALAGHKDG